MSSFQSKKQLDLLRKIKSDGENFKNESGNVIQEESIVRPRPGIRVPNRNALRRNNRNVIEPRNENSEGDDEVEQSATVAIDPKLGAKKRAKMEAKAEKKFKREAELQEREERKKKQDAKEEERKAREDLEKIEEQERLELEQKVAAEKAKKDHEEYIKLKETFGVEEEGYEETLDEDGGTLAQFIEFIKKNKIIILDELALKFKLKTQVVIDRIQSLLEQGSLTGVIDDRGKFIYISQAELDAVASFIKKRGRVSITELAEQSNKLIALDKPAV